MTGSSSPSPSPADRRGVVAVIVHQRRLLVIRRSEFVRAPLQWCFPGGSIEAGETEEQAVVREVREELSLVVQPTRRLWQSVAPSGIGLAWWQADGSDWKTIAPNPYEVAEFDWLSIDELRRLPQLLRSNHAFLAALDAAEFVIAGMD
jgi:8-oxo-dGTP pyrophosphatase MutT (NUDIX family)